MVAIADTVAFVGIEARLVEVQAAVAPGLPAFTEPNDDRSRYAWPTMHETTVEARMFRDSARRDRACTELYGGPHRAFVTGTLRGRKVSARLSRVDGCAIAAYAAKAAIRCGILVPESTSPGISMLAERVTS